MTGTYMMKLGPVPRSTIWGGTRLRTLCGTPCGDSPVGEAWMLTVRGEISNTVAGGPLSGRRLDGLAGSFGEDPGDFPLLVKLIDAADSLSVQVHPDDIYAAAREHDRGKTEMWYILEADPGSELLMGLVPGAGRAAFGEALRDGDVLRVMNRVPVRPGDSFFIPAGMPHAIGKGILLAEIQENSDLTYRVYDYGRKGADGRPRRLDTDKAMDVISAFTPEQTDRLRYENDPGADRSKVLCDCARFRAELMRLCGPAEMRPSPRFRHILVTRGSGEIEAGEETLRIAPFDSILLPPHTGARLSGDADLLVSSPRQPVSRLSAPIKTR